MNLRHPAYHLPQHHGIWFNRLGHTARALYKKKKKMNAMMLTWIQEIRACGIFLYHRILLNRLGRTARALYAETNVVVVTPIEEIGMCDIFCTMEFYSTDRAVLRERCRRGLMWWWSLQKRRRRLWNICASFRCVRVEYVCVQNMCVCVCLEYMCVLSVCVCRICVCVECVCVCVCV